MEQSCCFSNQMTGNDIVLSNSYKLGRIPKSDADTFLWYSWCLSMCIRNWTYRTNDFFIVRVITINGIFDNFQHWKVEIIILLINDLCFKNKTASIIGKEMAQRCRYGIRNYIFNIDKSLTSDFILNLTIVFVFVIQVLTYKSYIDVFVYSVLFLFLNRSHRRFLDLRIKQFTFNFFPDFQIWPNIICLHRR